MNLTSTPPLPPLPHLLLQPLPLNRLNQTLHRLSNLKLTMNNLSRPPLHLLTGSTGFVLYTHIAYGYIANLAQLVLKERFQLKLFAITINGVPTMNMILQKIAF